LNLYQEATLVDVVGRLLRPPVLSRGHSYEGNVVGIADPRLPQVVHDELKRLAGMAG